MQGVLPSEGAKIQAQINNLEVDQPQGRHDACPEGGWLPLAFHCYAMKASCPSSSAHTVQDQEGSQSMQGVLPSEWAKIQAQINYLQVNQPQGRHDACPGCGWLPLAFHWYAMKASCPSSSAYN
ncbi:hypothetical protein THAOC_16304 [Thalassiosira oceanica]|uniref:Uncharacterized protein n=1 Tax=Thalassiosira oceanica TaxID=159749 RepID=K0SDL0_THAOC|nr:hypothetical protein THAOC_16304 [Thalassiosira oceanica]|eukprot:EJK63059.1 hypothetical protein THAOC_16304 [Thalassiosira oceanica]